MNDWPYADEVGCATPDVIRVTSAVLAVMVVIGAIGVWLVRRLDRMRPW